MAAPVPAWSPPEIINVLGALGALLLSLTASIIAIVKSFHTDNTVTRTDAKADALTDRVNSQAQSIRENRNAITKTALAVTPGGTFSPSAMTGTADNPAQVEVVNDLSEPVPTSTISASTTRQQLQAILDNLPEN